eukprot:6757987-Pyramimonas_sp.AAC.1
MRLSLAVAAVSEAFVVRCRPRGSPRGACTVNACFLYGMGRSLLLEALVERPLGAVSNVLGAYGAVCRQSWA